MSSMDETLPSSDPAPAPDAAATPVGAEPVSSKAAWYALKTRSRHEKAVARVLAERGVRVFLPLFRKRRRWSDRYKIVETPVFSTYVFVHIDPKDRLVVLRVKGSVQLLGNAGEPTPVADSEINSLLALEAGGAPIEPHRFVKVGQRARIAVGPFRGVEGTLVKRDATTKLVVSVTLFQRSVALTVDAADVEPA